MGVFVSVISNFYFFYMLVILTVLYVGVRLITIYGVKLQVGGWYRLSVSYFLSDGMH